MNNLIETSNRNKQILSDFNFFDQNSRFKVQVCSIGNKLSSDERLNLIEEITEKLHLKGKIELINPIHQLILYIECSPLDKNIKKYYLGIDPLIGMKKKINEFSLKDREFIGTTSMDPLLSFLMANLGHAKQNSFVYDPFVGTGSILLACANFSSYVFGTDINKKVLHGLGKSSKHDQKWNKRGHFLKNNFICYNLQNYFLDCCVNDISRNSIVLGRKLFDAVITDPPYGIRETCSTPQMIKDSQQNIYSFLLNLSAELLAENGRLVFWFPTLHKSNFQVPIHPCFSLISMSPQLLNKKCSRLLIVMKRNDMRSCNFNSTQITDEHIKNFRDKYFSKVEHKNFKKTELTN